MNKYPRMWSFDNALALGPIMIKPQLLLNSCLDLLILELIEMV